MFYCDLLLRKNGKFFLLWIAATQDGQTLNRYLTPRKVLEINLPRSLDDIIEIVQKSYPGAIPRSLSNRNVYFSLYLAAKLLFGSVVVLNKQAILLFHDLHTIFQDLNKRKWSEDKQDFVKQLLRSKTAKKEGFDGEKQKKVAESSSCDEDVDVIDLDMSHYDDGSPLVFPEPADPRSITMEEYDFPPFRSDHDADLSFGDEGRPDLQVLIEDLGVTLPSHDEGPSSVCEQFQPQHLPQHHPEHGDSGLFDLREAVPFNVEPLNESSETHEVLQLSKPVVPEVHDIGNVMPRGSESIDRGASVVESRSTTTSSDEGAPDTILPPVDTPDILQPVVAPDILPHVVAQQKAHPEQEMMQHQVEDFVDNQPQEVNVVQGGVKRKRAPKRLQIDEETQISREEMKWRTTGGSQDTIQSKGMWLKDTFNLIVPSKIPGFKTFFKRPGRQTPMHKDLSNLFTRHLNTRSAPEDFELTRMGQSSPTIDSYQRSLMASHLESTAGIAIQDDMSLRKRPSDSDEQSLSKRRRFDFEITLQRAEATATPVMPPQGVEVTCVPETSSLRGEATVIPEMSPRDEATAVTDVSPPRVEATDIPEMPTERVEVTGVPETSSPRDEATVIPEMSPRDEATAVLDVSPPRVEATDVPEMPTERVEVTGVPETSSPRDEATVIPEMSPRDVATAIPDVSPLRMLPLGVEVTGLAEKSPRVEATGIPEKSPPRVEATGVPEESSHRIGATEMPFASPASERSSGQASSGSSRLPTQGILQQIYLLCHERNSDTIFMGDLCPPTMSRLQAARTFMSLLALHQDQKLTLSQTKGGIAMEPITITMR